jgi:hypothetical protein
MNFKKVFLKKKTKKYLLVIPVLNEGILIKKLVIKIIKLKIHKLIDVLIVDGGSNDGSIKALNFAKKYLNGIIIVKNNTGLSKQLRAAYKISYKKKYYGTITIDGNFKDDPKKISIFIKYIEKGYHFVQGSRFIKGGGEENTPLIRKYAIKLIHAPVLSFYSKFNWSDTTQGYRGYNNIIFKDKRISIFRNIFKKYELLAYLNYILPLTGYSCIEIPTFRKYNKFNKLNSKIKGFSSNFEIIKVLFKVCWGHFNKKR